jgi:hypothetical protein
MLGDEGETHPSSAAAPAGSRHRSTAERVSSGRFDPFAEPPGNGRYLRTPAIAGPSSDDKNPAPRHSRLQRSDLSHQAIRQLI